MIKENEEKVISKEACNSGGMNGDHIFILRVKEEKNGCLIGNVQPLRGGTSFFFSGIGSAVLAVDRLIDILEEEKNGKPDTGDQIYAGAYEKWLNEEQEKGAFIQSGCPEEEHDWQHFEVFVVNVRYRQHRSWQGGIQWNGKKMYFRSELEMMHLVQSVFQKESLTD